MSDQSNTTAQSTVTLTISSAELLSIYEAGIRRGEDEATSRDWGNRPQGDRLTELETLMVWGYAGRPVLSGTDDERQAAWARIREAMSP